MEHPAGYTLHNTVVNYSASTGLSSNYLKACCAVQTMEAGPETKSSKFVFQNFFYFLIYFILQVFIYLLNDSSAQKIWFVKLEK